MFTRSEINDLDRHYFDILGTSPFAITLRSRNTGHEWHILMSEGTGWQSCRILHRHRHSDSWHKHPSEPTLNDAVAVIQRHDRYQMRKDEAKRKRLDARASNRV